MDFAQSAAGFFVGALIGLSGVGGGSLMTPLLDLVFGVSPGVAVGTDLAFACATKSVGIGVHRKLGHIRWDIARLLILGALPASLMAAWGLSSHGRLDPALDGLIRASIGVSVGLTALALMAKTHLSAWASAHHEGTLSGPSLTLSTVAVGAIIGALVTVSSIGAGAIGATAIALLYPRLNAREVAGTDIAYAVPLTLLAALIHWRFGSIDWLLLLTLLAGSIPGIFLGSLASGKIPEPVLRWILCAMLACVSAKLLW
jgi:uncharacterized membrane protein YfcA